MLDVWTIFYVKKKNQTCLTVEKKRRYVITNLLVVFERNTLKNSWKTKKKNA